MIPGIHKRFDPIRTLLWGLCLLQGALLAHSAPSLADVTSAITSDGTLGTSVSQAGNVFDIDGGTLKGTNQFHSFDRFDVGTGDIASFNGPNVVENILGRVTGLQSGLEESMIDGTLRSTIEGANLYLINPAGVLFGPNASLDLTGSFHISTADYLRLSDGARFNALPGQADTVLTSAPVAAFGFLKENPAGISVESGGGGLAVNEGQTLVLVGGDLSIQDSVLSAPAGQLQLASAGSADEVIVSATGLDTDSLTQGGAIRVSDASSLDVSGEGGGRVVIRGGQFVLEGQSEVRADTLGARAGLGIDIDVGRLEVREGAVIAANAQEGSTGDAGDLTVKANDVEVRNGGQIVSVSFSEGNGGDVLVEAESIFLSGDGAATPTGIAAQTAGSGAGGWLTVRAKELKVLSGAGISAGTFAEGNGGDLLVEAEKIFLSGEGAAGFTGIDASTRGSGAAGRLTVKAKDLQVRNDAEIGAATFAEGNGGNLLVEAEKIFLSGDGATGFTGIDASTRGSGAAGRLTVKTKELEMRDGARISTNTSADEAGGSLTVKAKDLKVLSGAVISASTFAEGNGGELLVEAESIFLSGDGVAGFTGIAASTQGGGAGGRLTVKAKDLQVRNDADISANTLAEGNGGDLLVEAESIFLSGDGAARSTGIGAQAQGSGDGGRLTVKTKDLQVRNGATISAGTLADGDGGELLVEAESIVLSGRATGISAQAQGNGDGRRLTVKTKDLKVRNGAFISANTFAEGNAGELLVEAENILLSGRATGIGAQTRGSGAGGRLTVKSKNLQVRKGATISATTFAEGNGGEVLVEAESIFLSGDGTTGLTGISGQTFGKGAGGSLTVKAKDLQVRSDGDISANTFAEGSGGELLVEAENILLSGDGTAGDTGIRAQTVGKGAGGRLTVKAKDLQVRNGATISATTLAEGNGGELLVEAKKIFLSGEGAARFTGIGAQTRGSGAGGRLTVKAKDLQVRNDADISATTFAEGNAGELMVEAGSIFLSGDGAVGLTGISAETRGSGTGGSLTVKAKELQVRNGAVISTSTTGSGVAGLLIFNVDSLNVQGGSAITSSSTGVAPSANAGSITIEGREGGSAATLVEFTNSALSTSALGESAGGGITVNAEQVVLTDTRITTETSEGRGGSIAMSAAGSLTLTATTVSAVVDGGDKAGGNITLAGSEMRFADGTDVTASRGGTGSIGNITIGDRDTVNLQLRDSTVSTDATNVSGGNIKINAQNIVGLTDASEISASVVNGDGGNVKIDPEFTILNDGSAIRANADAGRGGNISIDGIVIRSADSVIEATGTEPGTVDVDAQEDVISNVTALPAEFQDPARRLRQRCGERVDVGRSTFGEVGLDGLPLSPEAYLSATVPLPPASEQETSLSRPLTDLGETHVPFISCRDG